MTHTLTISDDLYERLLSLAQEQGQTPEDLIAALITQAEQQRFRPADYLSYSDEEWMRLLGMSDEDIAWMQAHAASRPGSRRGLERE